jgi:hypothetical protein
MAKREPFRYELQPRSVDEGTGWLSVTLENVSDDPVRSLDVSLNTLDDYSIEAVGEGAYVPVLDPGAQEVLPLQVIAKLSGSLYISVDGERAGEPFHWESPDITVTVADQVAEMASLLTLADTSVEVGEMMRCEATIRGQAESEGLRLEFWAQTPGGAFEELAIVETKHLGPGEEARYVAEVEAEEVGRYTVYAYLYDGTERIGRRVETLLVEAA